jgi:hypothetical protein
MKTIQIPSPVILNRKPVYVGYDCDVDLHFTENGVFWRSKQGNYFLPSGMFQGYATANSDHTCMSPEKDLAVHWKFITSDGSETEGDIIVLSDGNCA